PEGAGALEAVLKSQLPDGRGRAWRRAYRRAAPGSTGALRLFSDLAHPKRGRIHTSPLAPAPLPPPPGPFPHKGGKEIICSSFPLLWGKVARRAGRGLHQRIPIAERCVNLTAPKREKIR